jgi:hypothetical protein
LSKSRKNSLIPSQPINSIVALAYRAFFVHARDFLEKFHTDAVSSRMQSVVFRSDFFHPSKQKRFLIVSNRRINHKTAKSSKTNRIWRGPSFRLPTLMQGRHVAFTLAPLNNRKGLRRPFCCFFVISDLGTRGPQQLRSTRH